MKRQDAGRKNMADTQNEWQKTTLGDLVTFQSGGTPSKDNPSYWNGAIPWVSAKDMKQLFLDDSEDHVTDIGAANGTKLVPPATVLMLARGMTLLNDVPICVVRRQMTFNQDVKALHPKGNLEKAFLPYLLLGNKRRLLRMVDLAGLNTEEVKQLDVRLPPPAEQRAIACILGALDDKIELNRRRNRTLEAMARAIFQSWFVDFDPVRAKAEGRTPVGMSKEVAKLFPATFEDSALGPIPKGWCFTSVGVETDFLAGYAFKSDQFIDDPSKVRLARGDNVKEGFFHWGEKSRYWEAVTPDIARYELQARDTLIRMDGSKVGKNWTRVRACDLPCLLVQRVTRLRPAKSIGDAFISLLVSDLQFQDYVERVKTGTSIPHISGGQIQNYEFVRPPR